MENTTIEETTGADTIELLESRLRRIEFLLTGNSSWSGEPSSTVSAPVSRVGSRLGSDVGERTEDEDGGEAEGRREQPVATRLAKLEHDLKTLSADTPAVRHVLQLCRFFLIFPFLSI